MIKVCDLILFNFHSQSQVKWQKTEGAKVWGGEGGWGGPNPVLYNTNILCRTVDLDMNVWSVQVYLTKQP